MNKFEEEKKAKYLTEGLEPHLRQYGIETNDEALYVMYESFENRDQKYVYFMKRGYPIKLEKIVDGNDVSFKMMVYDHGSR
jgi:hypothetical protein